MAQTGTAGGTTTSRHDNFFEDFFEEDYEADSRDELEDTALGMDGELQLSLAPGHGLAVGSEFMLHRVLVDGRWQACPVGTAYATADNIIHRYDREVGFAVSAADQAEEDSTPAVHQAAEAARQDPKKSWSHWQRVSRMALFLRWLRARCPTSPYKAWLRELERGIYAKQNGEHFERLAYKVRLHISIVSAHDNHPHAQACPALCRWVGRGPFAHPSHPTRADAANLAHRGVHRLHGQ